MSDGADLSPVVAKAVLDIAEWYSDLEEYLLPRRGRPSEIKHKDGAAEPLPIDYGVSRTRTAIRWHMHCWVKIGLEEGPFDQAPEHTVEAQAAWLHQRNDWYCSGQPDPRACQEYIDQTLILRRECVQQQQPNEAHRITLKPFGDTIPCPKITDDGQRCTGTLIAVIRPADDLLPTEVRCDMEAINGEHHSWTPDEWITLGRRVVKETA